MRYAIRTLIRQPLFTLTAIATLAIGIGVNSTIFTFANAAFFRGMPGISEPERLVWMSSAWRDRGRPGGMSYPDFVDYREGTRDVFVESFAFQPTPLSLGSGGEPQRIRGHLVSGSYFSALGVTPAAGRLLAPDDDRPGSAGAVVIGHRLWTERFDASPDALRSTIVLNGRSFPIVGVAPEHFTGPALGEAADAWLPISLLPDVRVSDRTLLTNRASSWLLVIGRLRPGVPLRGAQAAVSGIAARLEQAYPASNEHRLAVLSSAASGLPPEGRGELLPLGALLLTVTGIVLMIACANVANLLLARGAARASEISIRAAIGATRPRLIRQLLGESALLGVAGAIAGLILSFWAADLLFAQLPEAEFRGWRAVPDVRVLLFTGGLAVASVCAFGLLPAFAATRGAFMPRLRATPSAGGRTRLQGVFVVAQLSLSLVLLLAGGLSLRALQKSRAIDLGFQPDGVLTASYDLVLQNYSPEKRTAFRRSLRERIAALPGVTDVGIANMAPLGGTMVSTVVETPGAGGRPSEARAYLNAVGPGYFGGLRIPLLRGRDVSPTDVAGAPAIAIVNQRLARDLWGADDPLGRVISLGERTLHVIGVARDSKYDDATEDPRPFIYTSIDQVPHLDRETLVIRSASSPAALANAVRGTVRAMDPALPVFDVRTFDAVLRERADKERGISVLLAAFGGMALLLAALGLYGVMAYAVARRTREIGIRLALGATPSQVSALIAADGLRLALIGVGIGGALSLPMAYALGALLFGIQIADVAAFVLICAGLIAVAVAASLLPARRAARLDPVFALRTE